MKRKSFASLVLLAAAIVGFNACNDEKKDSNDTTTTTTTTPTTDTANAQEVHGTEVKPGEITYQTPLNAEWVANGKSIYELKCASCHKLTEERLVGPGWKGVTKKRQPEWIVNMITNVDMMLETDPEAQKLLEQCLVRMPNHNITKDEARHIIEYMRQNDGEK
jgi:cytochrome c5